MTRPAYDPDEAQDNSRRKARLIAEYAYRCGITWEELGALPYSDKADRKRPTLRRFAAAAFDARGEQENVPHSRTSDTWRHVYDELTDLEDRERYGFPEPAHVRDLLDQRPDWVRPSLTVVPDQPPDEIPAETPPPRRPRPVDLAAYDVPPALVTSGPPRLLRRPAPSPPRGWTQLATLPRLDQPCRWCGRPAVVGTLNGWRCPAHPPTRGDPRGDWGWALDWTPHLPPVCLISACYCGRCTHYDPAGHPVKQGARAGQG